MENAWQNHAVALDILYRQSESDYSYSFQLLETGWVHGMPKPKVQPAINIPDH
jgi:hypothetical protein